MMIRSTIASIQRAKYPALLGVLIVIGVGIGATAVNEIAKQNAGRNSAIAKVDMAPVRGEFQPLLLRRTGFEYKCNECHQTIPPSHRRKELLAEHSEIKLEHGSNNFCLNCHHKTNRNAYVDHDGSEIPSDQPAKLCSKCHGIVYRDWLAGAHGKLTGSWKPGNEQAKRLLCIQCHDPHHPNFQTLKPMPGPRYGESLHDSAHSAPDAHAQEQDTQELEMQKQGEV